MTDLDKKVTAVVNTLDVSARYDDTFSRVLANLLVPDAGRTWLKPTHIDTLASWLRSLAPVLRHETPLPEPVGLDDETFAANPTSRLLSALVRLHFNEMKAVALQRFANDLREQAQKGRIEYAMFSTFDSLKDIEETVVATADALFDLWCKAAASGLITTLADALWRGMLPEDGSIPFTRVATASAPQLPDRIIPSLLDDVRDLNFKLAQLRKCKWLTFWLGVLAGSVLATIAALSLT